MMSSSFIRVGSLADGKHASMTVQVDPATGLPVSGGGGGGSSDPAIVTNLEEIKQEIQNRIPRQITDVRRSVHDAQQYQGSPLQIPADRSRLRLRINNIVGDGNSQPIQGTAYLFVGHNFDPNRAEFDQVVEPGESILVDAPMLSIFIKTDSVNPMYGVFNVVEYF